MTGSAGRRAASSYEQFAIDLLSQFDIPAEKLLAPVDSPDSAGPAMSSRPSNFQDFKNLNQILETVIETLPDPGKGRSDTAAKSVLDRLFNEIPALPTQGFDVFKDVTKASESQEAKRRLNRRRTPGPKSPVKLPLPSEIKDKPRRGTHAYRPKIGFDDAHFQSEFETLHDQIMTIAQAFFAWDSATVAEVYSMWTAVAEHKILSHYINYISIGPPEQFQSLLEDPEERYCLVFGIISKALTHWVFDDLMFGGSLIEREALHLQDVASVKSEGFARTKQRAQQIDIFLGDKNLPKDFGPTVDSIAARIYTLVAPLIVPKSVFPAGINPHILEHYPQAPCLHQLYKIVRRAAKTSLDMRREGDCIYYLHSASKGEAVDGQKLTGLNEASFKEYRTRELAVEKRELAELREQQKDTPLDDWTFPDPRGVYVGIVCFPEVVVYRKGNGQMGGEKVGLRYKQLCKGFALYRYMKRQPVGVDAVNFEDKIMATQKVAKEATRGRETISVRITDSLFGRG